MQRDEVNEVLDDIACRHDWNRDEQKALLSAIEVTSNRTECLINMRKKELSRYTEGSDEYLYAKAFNKGMEAVLSVIADCFPDDEVDEEAIRERELEDNHLDYLARCKYDN